MGINTPNETDFEEMIWSECFEDVKNRQIGSLTTL